MVKVELVKNVNTSVIDVVINGETFGIFDKIDDDQYSFFPKKQDRMTGNHYIAIGNALNTINNFN